MKSLLSRRLPFTVMTVFLAPAWAGPPPALNQAIQEHLNQEFPSLLELYK